MNRRRFLLCATAAPVAMLPGAKPAVAEVAPMTMPCSGTTARVAFEHLVKQQSVLLRAMVNSGMVKEKA